MFRDKKNSLDWDIATIFERALVKSCISYKKTLASFLTFIMLLSIFNPLLVWATDESLQFDLTSEGTEETLTEFENNDDAPLGDIQIESVNEPSIVTTLTDLTTKADKLDFDLWVKDADGEKIAVSNVEDSLTVKEQLNRNLAYLVNTVDNPTLGTLGGEWSILALARGGYAVPDGYYDRYYSNIEKEVERLMPASGSKPAGRLDRNKGTEHSRVILGLTSIGKDITNVAGYDLRMALADFDYVTRQGINGPIFALIAFDSYNYEIPIDENVENQTTREKMINYILDKEIAGGGWALSGSNPDPDITAMAIQALTPYYQNNAQVKAAVDRAITWLSNAQKADGGYSSWGTENSESVAQVIVALTGLGIDPHTDSRFVKNGHSALDNLMSYALPSGGFKHIKSGDADAMATDQGTYALVAYDRFVEGKNRLYDMTDVIMSQPGVDKATLQSIINEAKANKDSVVVSVDGTDVDPTQNWVTQEEMTAYETAITAAQQVYENNNATQSEVDSAVNALTIATEIFNAAKKNGEKSVPTIPLPEPNQDGVVRIVIDENNKDDQLISNLLSNKDVKNVIVEIPASNQGRIMVDLPSNEALPRIEAVKGNVSVVFPQGVEVTSGDSSEVELLTAIDANNPSIINQVNTVIPTEKKLEKIDHVFTMGGSERVEFTDFVTLTIKDAKGKDAAYIQDGKLFPISKFNSDQDGKNSGKLEYAYESGDDLIVKTKHFTDFIVYTVGTDRSGSSGSSGGGAPPQTKNTITLSIDKFTINKGYVLPPTEVEFTPGESVWDVLQREMDKRGITYTYVWYPKYNSVYVEWIDGDGEFDHGSGSGWMYNVNGWYPNYGASLYTLKNGDVVQWRYTTNLGVDLGEDITKWEDNTPTDGKKKDSAKEIIDKNKMDLNNKKLIINVPKNSSENYLITIPEEYKDTEKITINIPIENNNTWLNLEEVKDDIPLIEVRKGNKILVLEKGTKLKTDQSNIQLFTQIDDKQQQLTTIINNLLVNEKVSGIDAFEMGNSSSSTIFSQPVTLLLEGEKGRQVGVIDHKGKWTPIKIYESREAAIGSEEALYAYVEGNDLVIKTNHFSTFVLYTKVSNRPLEDVYSDAGQISSWAYDVIQEATNLGIVEGYNGKIYPKTEITRAEFVKLMVNIIGLDLESGKTSVFQDVKKEDWFYSYVTTAYSIGMIAGYDDGNFYPNKTITREEMAVILDRVLDIAHKPSNVMYKDHDKISKWARNSVHRISTLGFMVGYDDKFHPRDFVTREMAIAVAMRVYHYKSK